MVTTEIQGDPLPRDQVFGLEGPGEEAEVKCRFMTAQTGVQLLDPLLTGFVNLASLNLSLLCKMEIMLPI